MTISPLLTDYYQLTMAYGYWQLQRAEQEAVFILSFRKNPFQSSYTVSAGLAAAIEFLQNYRFTADDLDYLASLTNSHNQPSFSNEFLAYLKDLRFSCDIDAVPEGTLVFPREPLLRIKGPLLQCQLLETPLLNLIGFPSLIATQSSLVCAAADWAPVMEFGLRRAQGPDGGVTASRAAFIGGCESTSNVLAGKLYDIPVKGTQAHSWIMSYPDEYTAFSEFVKVIDTTVLLVDTYHTQTGVENAIAVGKQLRQQGRDLQAIRLDSGDLTALSQQARAMLDAAGFAQTKIIASGDLDIEKITHLKKLCAPIDIWGVGTRLTTAYTQPALDITYKLSAIRNTNNEWQYKIKISDQPEKSTFPGLQQIRRYYQQDRLLNDVIYDVELGIDAKLPAESDRQQDLLMPIFRQGKLIYDLPPIATVRAGCIEQLKQFMQQQTTHYSVSLETKLQAVRDKLLQKSR